MQKKQNCDFFGPFLRGEVSDWPSKYRLELLFIDQP